MFSHCLVQKSPVRSLRVMFGNIGVLIVAALSGVADVDAVTISMARMGGKDIDLNTTVKGILVAVAVNTTSKAMLAGWAGGHKIGALVGSVSALARSPSVPAQLCGGLPHEYVAGEEALPA